MFKNLTAIIAGTLIVLGTGAAFAQSKNVTADLAAIIATLDALQDAVGDTQNLMEPKRVFVTSQTFTGDLVTEAAGLPGAPFANGLDAGDALCQAAADAASLGGVWQAWLSDANSSPTTRWATIALAPYVRLDGGVVAADYGDLADGELNSLIVVDEAGGAVDDDPVWSATGPDGSPDVSFAFGGSCQEWTIGDSTRDGSIGFPLLVGVGSGRPATWTAGGGGSCGNSFHLYCFEQ